MVVCEMLQTGFATDLYSFFKNAFNSEEFILLI